MSDRHARIREIIRGVSAAALEASGADHVLLLDPELPEHSFAAECCEPRSGARPLPARPWNKTALLLAHDLPREPFLPLGDLYAIQVRELAGGFWLPADAAGLVDRAGGIERVDRALSRWLDQRFPPEIALAELPGRTRGPFLEAVRRGRFWRERCGLVPKLSPRTIGIDLFA